MTMTRARLTRLVMTVGSLVAIAVAGGASITGF